MGGSSTFFRRSMGWSLVDGVTLKQMEQGCALYIITPRTLGRALALPQTCLSVEKIFEPNYKIPINVHSASVFPDDLMELGARNKARMVVCCLVCWVVTWNWRSVKRIHSDAITSASPSKQAYYISLHITPSHQRSSASSLSSAGWTQVRNDPGSSSVLVEATGLSSRACCASCCLSDLRPRLP